MRLTGTCRINFSQRRNVTASLPPTSKKMLKMDKC